MLRLELRHVRYNYLMPLLALKLFQDVVLSILFMLRICDYDPNAC